MRSATSRLTSVPRLSREGLLLAQAWAGLLVAHLALRLLPPRRLFPRSDSAAAPPRVIAAPAPSPERVAALVDRAGRWAPVRTTCLTRALVLSWMLRRQGVITTLRIGVARRDGTLTAHAWLETRGGTIPGLPGCDGHAVLLARREPGGARQ